MDRASAIAIIREIIELAPERVFEVIADVVRSIAEGGRYSAEEVSSAIDELLQELDRHQRR
jgi:methyl-accepting chemotaxis protein